MTDRKRYPSRRFKDLRRKIDSLGSTDDDPLTNAPWLVADFVGEDEDGKPMWKLRRRDARLLSMIESEPRLKGQGVIVWRVVKPSPEFEEERQSAMARRARGTVDHPDDERPPEYPDETDQPVSIAPGLRRQQEWARARRIIDNQTSAPGLDSPRSAEKAGRRVSARVIPLINPNGTRRR